MPMRQRTSVVRIRFVDVLRRDGGRGRHPRDKGKNQGDTPDYTHAGRLSVGRHPGVKPARH
jgi:hypothetical protein